MNETNGLPINRAGYWISPNNCFFTVEKHIFSVCDWPERFGATDAGLRAVFARFDEEYRTENSAREAIIKALVKNGWIRLRHYIRNGADDWSINMPSRGTEPLGRVCAFMRQVYGDRTSYTDVRLDSPGIPTVKSSVDKLVSDQPPPEFPINVEALPQLCYLTSPEALPLAGIPPVNLDMCCPASPS